MHLFALLMLTWCNMSGPRPKLVKGLTGEDDKNTAVNQSLIHYCKAFFFVFGNSHYCKQGSLFL